MKCAYQGRELSGIWWYAKQGYLDLPDNAIKFI